VSDLYNYRDTYFSHHPLEEANLREERVAQKIEEALKQLEKIEGQSNIIGLIHKYSQISIYSYFWSTANAWLNRVIGLIR